MSNDLAITMMRYSRQIAHELGVSYLSRNLGMVVCQDIHQHVLHARLSSLSGLPDTVVTMGGLGPSRFISGQLISNFKIFMSGRRNRCVLSSAYQEPQTTRTM